MHGCAAGPLPRFPAGSHSLQSKAQLPTPPARGLGRGLPPLFPAHSTAARQDPSSLVAAGLVASLVLALALPLLHCPVLALELGLSGHHFYLSAYLSSSGSDVTL